MTACLSVVTGSSGLLGGCLVPLLAARGDRLRLIDIVPADGDPAGDFIQADLQDTARVAAAVDGAEVVYHLAAAQRMKPQFARLSERQIFAMNVRGTENVLGAAERAGVRKVVVISSSGVYGVPRSVPCREDHPERPLGAYGESKRVVERLCREVRARGLDVTVLRPMSLFGPRMTGIFVLLFEWVRRGSPVYMLGDGANRIQTTSGWDLARACIRAVDTAASSGEVLNIGSEPDTVPTVEAQVRTLIAHAGSHSSLVRIPAALLRNAARALHAVGLSPIVPEHYILADRTFVLDIERAKAVLGWRPEVTNVEMMTAAYDWYVRDGAAYRPAPHPVLGMLDRLTRAVGTTA